MKTIGLIGGMSWHSTTEYYKIINEEVHKRLGGWHSAKILMYSVDFGEIDLEHLSDSWKQSDDFIISTAQKMEKFGANVILLCANTAHVLYDKIQQNVKIPVLHIADATAEKIKLTKIKTIGLLGTKHTMQESFYKERLENYGFKVLAPKEKEAVHKEICEICMGKISSKAKQVFMAAIDDLIKQGAEGVILGCTEIPLVIKQKDVSVPVFDTTEIHAKAAVDFALSD